MSLDQGEVLQNLIKQRKELEGAIGQLQGQLEGAKTQYLKLTGAIDVLTQLNPPEVPEVPEVPEEESEKEE